MTEPKSRAEAAVIGALVADAASLGFHWLYDQPRIAELAPDAPEFRTPDAADFEGVPGYFAHGGKAAGELSHYGHQMMVMLNALAEKDGKFDKLTYEDAFEAHFGYGGAYVGYIDRPTRDTLEALIGVEPSADKFYGADDQQLPAISKLPPLIAAEASDAEIEAAIRVTNNKDEAVAYGMVAAKMLRGAIAGETMRDAIMAAIEGAPDSIAPCLQKPLIAADQESIAFTADVGMACNMDQAMPSIIHQLLVATDYTQAIRTNILAGGDSCGRAIIIGAMMGAGHGIPEDWIGRVNDLPIAKEALAKIV